MAGIVGTAPSVTAIEAKTDLIPTDPADQSQVEAAITAAHATTDGKLDNMIARELSSFDFWSNSLDVIDLPAAAADKNLPDVVVAGIPSGATVLRVVAMLKVRAIENTSATGANAIQGAQAIRVKKSTGSWPGSAAIDLADNLWTVALSTRDPGDVPIGDNHIKSLVTGDGTYNLRFEDALVDYAVLRLNDVLVGLRFFLQAG